MLIVFAALVALNKMGVTAALAFDRHFAAE
jgi:hypothetical protein